jgi:hypothetical protein
MTVTRIALLAALAAGVCGALAAAEEAGLVVHYAFEEGKGDVVSDSSGKGNEGVVHDTYWVEGDFGKALEFNGRSSWIDCGMNPSLDFSEAGTISVWCLPTRPDGGLVGHTDGVEWINQRLVLTLYPGANVMWAVSDGASEAHFNVGSVRMRAWTHVAVTFNGETVKVYLNGKPTHSKDCKIKPNVKGVPLVIGRSSGLGPAFFQGLIDDVRMYNRALSPEEIQKIHKAESKGR